MTDIQLRHDANPLPDKLSDLLSAAVDDARKIAKTPGFKLDMSVYHEPIDGVCRVCMAGASMHVRFAVKKTDGRILTKFSARDRAKLTAIDWMRIGWFTAASRRVEMELPDEPLVAAAAAVRETFNSDTGRAHWRSYYKAARILREAGF